MRRDLLPIEALPAWARLNNVELNGVQIATLPANSRAGVIKAAGAHEGDAPLMTVPQDLILSLENIWNMAKSDTQLREILEAVGDYSRTARGAILIFLFLQITRSSPDLSQKVGVANPFTEYIKFLPPTFPLPTFWNDAEVSLLHGTSLEAALESKIKGLDREFNMLCDSTQSIWCEKLWWDNNTGPSLADWKIVDAMYRSRALDLPGTGHAMVPCIDMANHASGDATIALYETDADGNGTLVLRDNKSIDAGEEVTITYGDEKGACEMLFSYGFIEDSMISARELFLDLEIPEDDPLRMAKKVVARSAPGFRISIHEESIIWEGPFVWLVCVNEEDGLRFQVLQSNDGTKELVVSWKGREIEDTSKMGELLKEDDLWDVYSLRASSVLQDRVERQLIILTAINVDDGNIDEESIDLERYDAIIKLRDLEESLMLHAYQHFEEEKIKLSQSDTVQEYLRTHSLVEPTIPGDDFTSPAHTEKGF